MLAKLIGFHRRHVGSTSKLFQPHMPCHGGWPFDWTKSCLMRNAAIAEANDRAFQVLELELRCKSYRQSKK